MNSFERVCRRCGLGVVAALAALVLLQPMTAVRADDASPGKVVATVNGEPITDADVAVAAREFAQDLAQVPVEQQRPQVISILVDIKLLAKAAEGAGLDKSDSVMRDLAFVRERILRNEYLKAKVMNAVTDAAIKERFDQELAAYVPADQVHVRHILLKTEDEAKAVIADLDKGGDFAEIAKAKSQDPGSAPNGGDLGFISKGQTVPPFEAAAYTLPVGTYSKTPVQTDYGWHVLKVEETRKAPPPTLDERKDEIRNTLLHELFTKVVGDLHASADIKILETPPAPPATPPAADGATPPPADATAPPAAGGTAAPATPAPAQ